jgi:hypothetical protein
MTDVDFNVPLPPPDWLKPGMRVRSIKGPRADGIVLGLIPYPPPGGFLSGYEGKWHLEIDSRWVYVETWAVGIYWAPMGMDPGWPARVLHDAERRLPLDWFASEEPWR